MPLEVFLILFKKITQPLVNKFDSDFVEADTFIHYIMALSICGCLFVRSWKYFYFYAPYVGRVFTYFKGTT